MHFMNSDSSFANLNTGLTISKEGKMQKGQHKEALKKKEKKKPVDMDIVPYNGHIRAWLTVCAIVLA